MRLHQQILTFDFDVFWCLRNDSKYFVIHLKDDFAEVSTNLIKYKSKNNFVWTINIIM